MIFLKIIILHQFTQKIESPNHKFLLFKREDKRNPTILIHPLVWIKCNRTRRPYVSRGPLTDTWTITSMSLATAHTHPQSS